MTPLSNDQRRPWWVMVERLGPRTKGAKFYSAHASRPEAEAVALEATTRQVAAAALAAAGGEDKAYRYWVVKKT